MSTSSGPPPIVRFYDPHLKALDAQGRTLETILSWSDSNLEFSHDYIQTLFPLPERSPIDPRAPVIGRDTFTAFRARPELRARLRHALRRICRFYGFQVQQSNGEDPIKIERLEDVVFERRARNWVTRFNHNHLRISRIVRCLRVLGLYEEARAFFDAVKEVYDETGRIGDRSLMFWTRAMERPLFLAPEDEEDEGLGKDFLYEFEEQKGKDENAGGGKGIVDGGGEEGGEEGAEGDKDVGVDDKRMSNGTKRIREGNQDRQSTALDALGSLEDGEAPTNTVRRTKPKIDDV